MTDEKLNRLKEVLSIPTKSKNETLMIEYLHGVLTEKGYNHTVDKYGNIYVTKGEAEMFPCFISHTDTVHAIDHDLTILETKDGDTTILTGMNKVTNKPSGIGGDDKCGVFLCLEMLDTFDNVKAAFFVEEEIGCLGSQHADPEFFSNVGYAIQYDSPEGDSMSMSLMGKKLFGKETEFGEKVSGLILEAGIDKWAYHPYTDVWQLMEKFPFSCLNLAAGYYNMHRDNEYVIVEDVQNAYELGLSIVAELGEARYERPAHVPEEPWWKRYGYNGYGYGGSSRYDAVQTQTKKDIITEDDSNGERGSEWDEFYDFYDRLSGSEESEEWIDLDETKIIHMDTPEWEDLFDYNEFNGGYSVSKFGTENTDFDW
jgi:di/tripeptidase